jgi:S-formylglutathione hydrolase FrmB
MKSITKKLLIPFVLLVLFSQSFAATVDTVITYSPSMKKNIKAVVIKPDSYSKGNNLPVVYLLHGYGGNQADWISKVPAITQYADQYNFIIVCPDGNIGSWYFDSPVDSSWKYETYVSKELVGWVDDHFSTIKNKTGRAITGLSMGGHGALYLAFKHQDVFGAAGSMSGGVDITPFPNNWDIAKRLGSYAQQPQRWENNTVINLTHLLTPNSLAIIIDCGTSDFFYNVNVKLHDKLVYSNIAHDFITRPGGHSWDYWTNAISYQLLFMNKYFVNAAKEK